MRTLLLVILLLPLIIFGQSGLRFSRITVDDGLSQNTVNAIIQDSRGFYWFATQDGLSRFDGSNFVIYRKERGANSVSDNFITAIAEGPDRAIWIGTRNGLNRLDLATGEVALFIRGEEFGNHQSVRGLYVTHMGGEEAIYVLLNNDLFRLTPEAASLEEATLFEGTPEAVGRHPKGVIVATGSEILLWNGTERKTLCKYPDSCEEVSGLVYRDGKLFFWNEFHLFEERSGEIGKIELNGLLINDLIPVNEELWLGTNRGLFRLEGETIQAARIYGNEVSGLTGDDVHSFFRDSENALWLCTNRYGAYRWDPGSPGILHLPGERLADPIVWSSLIIDSTLVIGTTRGIDFFKLNENWRDRGVAVTEQWANIARFEGFHAACLLYENGLLQVGTRHHGILGFRSVNGSWQRSPQDDLADIDGIYDILSLNDRTKVVSTNQRIVLIDSLGNQDELLPSELIGDGTQTNYTHEVSKRGNELWFCGISGIYIYDLSTRQMKQIKEGEGGEGQPFSITASVTHDKNYSWVSTLGGGLIGIPHEGGPLRLYSTLQGLTNDNVYGSLVTQNGILAATNDGLSVISDVVRNISDKGPLPFREHSQNAFGTLDGTPWFGGVNGMYLITELPSPPLESEGVLITDILINYLRPKNLETHLSGDLFDPQLIKLFPGDESLLLNVSIPGFGQANAELCYRLGGDRSPWIGTGRRNAQLNFSSLPQGNNRLDIGVRSGDQQEIKVLKTLRIDVRPPFWQATWFIALIVLLVITATVFIVRFQSRRRIREEILKREAIERVQEERQRISMELHDNIGAQVTHVITSLDNLSYKVATKRTQDTAENLNELSDFARGTMQTLRDTIWTINREQISLNDLADRFRDYMGRLLNHHENCTFEIELAADGARELHPTETIHVFRVLQESATNALKHADASRLSLRIENVAGHLRFTFSDNGKGFDPEQGASDRYGMTNMSARMKEIGGKFKVISSPGKGTSVVIEITLR